MADGGFSMGVSYDRPLEEIIKSKTPKSAAKANNAQPAGKKKGGKKGNGGSGMDIDQPQKAKKAQAAANVTAKQAANRKAKLASKRGQAEAAEAAKKKRAGIKVIPVKKVAPAKAVRPGKKGVVAVAQPRAAPAAPKVNKINVNGPKGTQVRATPDGKGGVNINITVNGQSVARGQSAPGQAGRAGAAIVAAMGARNRAPPPAPKPAAVPKAARNMKITIKNELAVAGKTRSPGGGGLGARGGVAGKARRKPGAVTVTRPAPGGKMSLSDRVGGLKGRRN
ncbi:unnamed protein product [Pedinophyceae sp. YPF-701]|nr:unnamed protein product [Pedinophyceae sp. YPF-701]